MAARYGIPYQGSKGRYAPMIYRAINNRRRDGDDRHLYDPFCGGYAISHYFTAQGWTVSPSDLDRYTVALLNSALTGNLGDIRDQWVERELFNAARLTPETSGLTDAEVGFVRQVWSFGNSGTSYIYGAHLEEVKRLAHHLVTSQEPSKRLEQLSKVSVRLQEVIADLPTPSARRRGWTRAVKASETDHTQPHSLAQLTDRERVERLTGLDKLQHMTASDRVRSLTEGEEVRAVDYREAISDAPDNSTIYLDPPYAGTEGYTGVEEFDHDQFWGIASSKAEAGAAVYVSEYSAPEGWEPILSFTRPNTMAADSKSKATGSHREHLFTLRRNS